MPDSSVRRRQARCAVTIVEVMAALALLATLLTAASQLLVTIAHQRRGVQRRAMAAQHAANLMEQVMAEGPLTEQEVKTWEAKTLDEALSHQLGDPQLKISFDPKTGDQQRGRRVTIELTWANVPGVSQRPIQLSAWRFRRRNP